MFPQLRSSLLAKPCAVLPVTQVGSVLKLQRLACGPTAAWLCLGSCYLRWLSWKESTGCDSHGNVDNRFGGYLLLGATPDYRSIWEIVAHGISAVGLASDWGSQPFWPVNSGQRSKSTNFVLTCILKFAWVGEIDRVMTGEGRWYFSRLKNRTRFANKVERTSWPVWVANVAVFV